MYEVSTVNTSQHKSRITVAWRACHQWKVICWQAWEGLGQQEAPVESPHGLLRQLFVTMPSECCNEVSSADSTFPIGCVLCLQLGRFPPCKSYLPASSLLTCLQIGHTVPFKGTFVPSFLSLSADLIVASRFRERVVSRWHQCPKSQNALFTNDKQTCVCYYFCPPNNNMW